MQYYQWLFFTPICHDIIKLMSHSTIFNLRCSSVTCYCEDWLRTTIQATLLQVFELKSKTRNVLPLFRIRRKSFAMTCHITLLFVATSYRGKSSEKIVQCEISFTLLCFSNSDFVLHALKQSGRF